MQPFVIQIDILLIIGLAQFGTNIDMEVSEGET